jgi:hypothetical protein
MKIQQIIYVGRFLGLLHRFELLEGNVHDQDVPPSGELVMSM